MLEENLPVTNAPINSPAVTRCCDAYNRELARSRNQPNSLRRADKAFLDAMPPLVSLDNIRDFIACIAQGMLIDVFLMSTSTRLLYAARSH